MTVVRLFNIVVGLISPPVLFSSYQSLCDLKVNPIINSLNIDLEAQIQSNRNFSQNLLERINSIREGEKQNLYKEGIFRGKGVA